MIDRKEIFEAVFSALMVGLLAFLFLLMILLGEWVNS